MALIAMTFAACASDDVGGTGEESIAISFGYGTRSASGTGETTFMTNEKVWLWATGSTPITAWQLSADGSGNFSSSKTYYWPKDGTSLQINAIHGNFTPQPTEGTTTWDGNFTHTVEFDQSTENNYRLSDLLQCSANVSQWDGSHTLSFNHLLAKVEVTLANADGASISDEVLANATVKISGIKPTATYNSSTGSVIVSGTAGEVTLGKIFSSNSKVREAIIAADQTVASLTFTVTLNNFPASGKSRTLTCSTTSATFYKGNKYKYTLTLNNNIIISTVSVSEWTDDAATTVIIPAAPVASN